MACRRRARKSRASGIRARADVSFRTFIYIATGTLSAGRFRNYEKEREEGGDLYAVIQLEGSAGSVAPTLFLSRAREPLIRCTRGFFFFRGTA